MPVMSLRAKINGKIIEAINDIVIHSSNYRVVRVDVQYEDKKQSFEGDGIIVCSPIGSAAYAYSAGGEKIPLSENKIGIVGICPYKKAFCPVIINADNFVKISTSKSALIADGILISYLKPNSQIIIEKGRDIMFYRQIAHHD
jgi:NAD+ kinase